MSERKVLNKYYPPDFDPTKIPKLKRARNRQFSIRIMAPFNMRCGTCGEYIYKGKKFNSRQEKVENEDYLGLMIFRFYIKCPRCVSEISFKTDPQNTDYELEAGATRNFEALRTAEKLAEAEMKEKEDEEKNNPMKVLENRTKASRQEMDMLETLDELRELNSRHAKLDHDSVLKLHAAYEDQLRRLQDEEDEETVRSIFGTSSSGESVKRLHDDEGDDDVVAGVTGSTPKLSRLIVNPSDILTQDTSTPPPVPLSTDPAKPQTSLTKTKPPDKKPAAVWQKSVGGLSSKNSLAGLVKKKAPAAAASGQPDQKTNKFEEKASKPEKVSQPDSTETSSESKAEISDSPAVKETYDAAQKEAKVAKEVDAPMATGLGMLGAYSDSDSDNSSNG